MNHSQYCESINNLKNEYMSTIFKTMELNPNNLQIQNACKKKIREFEKLQKDQERYITLMNMISLSSKFFANEIK
jgi:hypothetical protein